MTERRGIIRTVLGDVEPGAMGRTLPHEHLFIDFVGARATLRSEPISLANRHEAAHRPDDFRDNLQLTSVRDAIEELEAFRDAGGQSLVDATTFDLGRDPAGLRRASKATGVHIVAGCGFYVHAYQPQELCEVSAQEIRDRIVREVLEGDPASGVRAGIIGEIGLSWPVHPQESRVLQGAVMAQAATGAALSIHPGIDPLAPFDIVREVERAGGEIQRTIICHLDRTLFNRESFIALSRTGCYLELDLFGRESSYYDAYPVLPTDTGRIRWMTALIEAGALDQLLVSQDTWLKTDLRKYGGKGYGHLFRDGIPLMSRLGLSWLEIDQITIGNPAAALTFV